MWICIFFVSVFLSIVECVLFSGIQFGWSSLVFIYKDIGLYENLCPRNESSESSGACAEQDEYLNMFFSVACSSLFTLSNVVGVLHHRLGTTKTRLVFMYAKFTVWYSSLCKADRLFLNEKNVDRLLYHRIQNACIKICYDFSISILA
jgi:hypothetical protein